MKNGSQLRAMVLRKDTNRLMDELWNLGARGIFGDRYSCLSALI